jgi:uncharacterized membrane protein (DUF2068 family)
MEQHVKTLSVLFILWGIVGLVLAIGLLVLGAGAVLSLITADTSYEARMGATAVGGCITAVAVVFAALSIPNIIAGWGLSQRKSWARILTIVLGAIALTHFPVGTALGLYAIIVMMNDETKRVLVA